MTKSSPQVFVNLNFNHSIDEAKEFFNQTGILIITRGELFSGYANLLFEIYGSDIIIPEGIDSIGEHAFDGLPITSIKFPDSVEYIGEFAFRNTKLTEVDLSSVTGIDEYAFAGAPITSVKLSPNLYDLGPGAFSDTELQSVVVSSTPAPRTYQYYPPEYYVDEAFDKDTVLILDGIITRDIAEQLVDRTGLAAFIPEGVVGIDATAFAGMSVEKVILPDSLKTIGHSAFAGTQIREVVIPNGVTEIGEGAFAGAPLQSVNIPESVRSIGDYAFAGTQITKIQLPDSLESIGEGAFVGTAVESVKTPADVMGTGANAFPETSINIGNELNVDSSNVIAASAVDAEIDIITGMPEANASDQSQTFGTLNEAVDSRTPQLEDEPALASADDLLLTVINVETIALEPIEDLVGASSDGVGRMNQDEAMNGFVDLMAAPTEVLV